MLRHSCVWNFKRAGRTHVPTKHHRGLLAHSGKVKKTARSSRTGRFFRELCFFYAAFRGVLADAFDAFPAGGVGGISVGHGDDLPVPGGEPEAERPPAVLEQFKPGMPDQSLSLCQVRQTGQGSAEPNAFNTLPAKAPGGIDLRGGDGFPVAGEQPEPASGGGLDDLKPSHIRIARKTGVFWDADR